MGLAVLGLKCFLEGLTSTIEGGGCKPDFDANALFHLPVRRSAAASFLVRRPRRR